MVLHRIHLRIYSDYKFVYTFACQSHTINIRLNACSCLVLHIHISAAHNTSQVLSFYLKYIFHSLASCFHLSFLIYLNFSSSALFLPLNNCFIKNNLLVSIKKFSAKNFLVTFFISVSLFKKKKKRIFKNMFQLKNNLSHHKSLSDLVV